MQGNFERLLGDAAATLVETSKAWPRFVVALAFLLTAGSIYVAIAILRIDTDSDRILNPNLPVRQTNIALAEAAVADSPAAVILDQVTNGASVQMALLYLYQEPYNGVIGMATALGGG